MADTVVTGAGSAQSPTESQAQGSSRPPALVLASGSAARRAMLAAAGLAFAVDPADIDETAITAQVVVAEGRADGVAVALALARAKAARVALRHPDALVIGSDQVLALGDQLLDKPGTIAGARTQLQVLRGHSHALHSAVAVAVGGAVVWSAVDSARLTMRDISDAFIDRYLAEVGEKVTSSVGAYHLEGLGIQLFERIDGDYFTILGLPLLPLLGELRRRGGLAT